MTLHKEAVIERAIRVHAASKRATKAAFTVRDAVQMTAKVQCRRTLKNVVAVVKTRLEMESRSESVTNSRLVSNSIFKSPTCTDHDSRQPCRSEFAYDNILVSLSARLNTGRSTADISVY
jgi:hypothetical protein